ncbi:WD40/YVTN/BNR-like repeat-containing protein [Algoriphagus sediminis]|uniref:Glycosyl hydrolase n=1 Tax=Algoriphagus sediminis TaxID=3057113 RepID=A0ABT7YF02_9BACT|nr:glycosyl hydrolase [Algoriphagus sediminis]MDN3205046.1 glycosyl hydrolase [Algoriphagus sediminis]
MRVFFKGLLALFTLLLCLQANPSFSQKKNNKQQSDTPKLDTALYQGMEFRLVGPFRGGRATAVAGVVQDPMTYYMGATGGVWKTTDAGESWFNISDGFFNTASVGAIAVSESDPNVVYVGMGEAPVRGVMTSHGDGVYKSTDAGKTWTHLGLEKTRQISKIVVHPENPDMLIVGAQGSPYGATEDRGIYRSVDGGTTWEKVHFVDENSGVADLSMDMNNPRVIYASYWDHRRFPWKVQSGGPGSGLYKSIDMGLTWKKMEKGLPESTLGKMGISVSRANSNIVWAIIEAEDGGLYRSDDAGESWRLVNPDRLLRARSWYYMHIQAHPKEPETVYVMNAPLVESTDGGKTFKNMRTRHGDNHQLWINPEKPNFMVNANDGGANVSIDRGTNWSRQDNQPTAQFYRVNVDRQFPYRIYGGQQDNSSVSIASRANGPGIGWSEFYPVGGCESAYSAFDPDNPIYIYSGCYQGIITEWNADTELEKDVMAYPFLGLGSNPRDLKYRFNWNAPIIASKHDPSVIYHAGNVILKTTNRGLSWEEISPDLTKNDTANINWGGGPITNEGAGGEVYHTIHYLAESPHTPDVIYAGADDGLLHVTQDGGQSWTEITIPGTPEGMVNQIEVSPHDEGTVYVAFNSYKYNDFTPHIFKSTDYGQSWTRLVNGIAVEAHVRVVREDPNQKDLLYAGTELGLYVSFDAGQSWKEFQQNLPVVPITDLMIQDNDMIVATQGRAFWVLDDLGPLYEMDAAKDADFYVYEPEDAIRDLAFRTEAPEMGQNPYEGFAMKYFVSELQDSTHLEVEIKDKEGSIIRTFTSDPSAKKDKIKVKKGMNQVQWDLAVQEFELVPGVFSGLESGPAMVPPGEYEAIFTYGDRSATKMLTVKPDPRWSASQADYDAQYAALKPLAEALVETRNTAENIRSIRDQVEDLKARVSEDDFPEWHEQADALIENINEVEGKLIQTKQKTFQDVINFPNQLDVKLAHIYGTIANQEPPVTEGQKATAADMLKKYEEMMMEAESIDAGAAALQQAMIDQEILFIKGKTK